MGMEDDPRSNIFERMFYTVNGGIRWSTEQIQSACPWRRKKGESQVTIPKGEIDVRVETRADIPDREKSKDSDREPRDYAALPSQICPPPKPSCCFIKMQDPCAPCCCEKKPAPCPPYHQEPREPTCGCDLCKKGYPNDKCCDHREAFRRATLSPRHFEKA